MNQNNPLEKVSLADDRFIEEADPTAIKPIKTKRKKMIFPLVASIALLLTVTISVAALPFALRCIPDTLHSVTAVGDYLKLYSAMLYAEKAMLPDDWVNGNFDINDGSEGIKGTYSPSNPSNSYQETTDNQVDGVIEPDRLKRSDRYLYYLDSGEGRNGDVAFPTLYIYSIDKENSTLVGSYQLKDIYCHELFLSQDCKTVTVIGSLRDCTALPGYSKDTAIILLDVSDPENITFKKQVTVSGAYFSARTISDQLLVVTSYYVDDEIKLIKPETFLPSVDDGNGVKTFSIDDVVYPARPQNRDYTNILLLNATDLSVTGKKALLSYNSELYVSKDNIYLACFYREISRHFEWYTDITALRYSDGSLDALGTATVEGEIPNCYCLDEYNGILRVAASLTIKNNSGVRERSAALYCIDLMNYKVVASVKNYAPAGEDVKSARFEGTKGYICTAIGYADPVFCFDLSDLSDITYTHTGVIDGFSANLTVFTDGYLLGIGYGANRNLKVELYKEENGAVVSVDKFEPEERWYFSIDYNDYYVDRKNALIGLGFYFYTITPTVNEHEGETCKRSFNYLLLHLENGKFTPTIIPLGGSDNVEEARCVYIDGYLYLMAGKEFIVQKAEF